MSLGAVDWGVLALYLIFVLGIGVAAEPAYAGRKPARATE